MGLCQVDLPEGKAEPEEKVACFEHTWIQPGGYATIMIGPDRVLFLKIHGVIAIVIPMEKPQLEAFPPSTDGQVELHSFDLDQCHLDVSASSGKADFCMAEMVKHCKISNYHPQLDPIR